MKVYVCPVCGESFMPRHDIYIYKKPSAGETLPCPKGCTGKVLPLPSPLEISISTPTNKGER